MLAKRCTRRPLLPRTATLVRRFAASTTEPSTGQPNRISSNETTTATQSTNPDKQSQAQSSHQSKKATMAQADLDLQAKMASLMGDGGEAGVEYEDGQPVAMKRSVKANMFRYI